MAIASIIVSLVGLVLSFVLGFPVSLLIGPYVGLPFGLVGILLSVIALKSKHPNAAKAGLIISIIVTAICVIRALSFASCIGKIAGSCIGAFS